ncbi:hypothetical protein [Sporomusa malonica]|uniref:Uncharacterized protein n=1 Tax=Sporomusa malonica TaxID=112901 RepID=A0A1W2BQU3_9FIRM|nr:hypothetical protein [Sporomusa malonica]SMC75299.1 hypothetical protein SAMN04488500_10884 [Sporomusa malonica]
MKSRLLVAALSVVVFTMVAIIAPVEAAALSNQDANLTQMKADEKRIKKLRHGYIKYDGNKVYYYW